MENIDNMAKNSLKSLSRDNLTSEGKKKLTRDIISGALAISCLAVGLIYSVIFPTKTILPALLYTIGFLIEGIPVFISAVKGIFSKSVTNSMEILVAIAIIACYFTGDLILAVLIPLILNIVHLLEERSIMGGRDVIEGLKRMQQSTAILLEDGKEITVDAKTLKVGQIIVVKPGTGIPIDGVVISGTTNIDQKSLTGEPQPAHVKEGDTVYAGTVNIDGLIKVRIEKEYVDTSFSKILNLLEKSETISIPESRLIDKLMAYYIPLVLAIAAIVALITADVNKAIAILVVSCPCGQMLVSSAPMIAALSAATKRGILIKNSKFIEELTEVDTVVFDKTGTVTEGNLSLSSIEPYKDISQDQLLSAAASVAAASTHPVSRAVANAAMDIDYDKHFDIKEISGKGLEGTSKDGSTTVRFGRREWLIEFGCDVPEDFVPDFDGSVSFVSLNGELIGALCFGDTMRENAPETVKQLKAMGFTETVMLTGDREAPAKRMCEQVGIDTVHAQLLPQDKLDQLRKLREDRNVLAVGDGINDALALREADVGIAMGAMGSDLAIQSADIALMNNNLLNIPFSVKLAKKTKAIIYQNLALSMGISIVMIGLSSFGVISALAGTILHNFGAFAVLLNSSRIIKLKD